MGLASPGLITSVVYISIKNLNCSIIAVYAHFKARHEFGEFNDRG